MRNMSDRLSSPSLATSEKPKRIGAYLMDAGLLTGDQINVALNDQQATGMRFGDILVARGWLKEQTIEWIVAKVIVPETKALQQNARPSKPSTPETQTQSTKRIATQPSAPSRLSPRETQSLSESLTYRPARRDAPISKSLPPVNTTDEDVSWVG